MSRSFLTTGAARTLAPREANVGDRLPYAGHLDDVTLQTRDGLLVQTLHLAGFPSDHFMPLRSWKVMVLPPSVTAHFSASDGSTSVVPRLKATSLS